MNTKGVSWAALFAEGILRSMRGWIIVVVGVLFCATTSHFGHTSLLLGAVTQSWAPYVAVPFAVGFTAARTSVARAGLLGALTSVLLVLSFYAVGPFGHASASVDTSSIFDYAPLGIVSGFLLAALSRVMSPRVATARWWWALACCSILTLALIASWWLVGWGTHDVVTPSGVITVGASTSDVGLSSAIVLALSCAVIVIAIHGLARDAGETVAAEQSRGAPQQATRQPLPRT